MYSLCSVYPLDAKMDNIEVHDLQEHDVTVRTIAMHRPTFECMSDSVVCIAIPILYLTSRWLSV